VERFWEWNSARNIRIYHLLITVVPSAISTSSQSTLNTAVATALTVVFIAFFPLFVFGGLMLLDWWHEIIGWVYLQDMQGIYSYSSILRSC
jgi:hypothetical protein